MKLPPGANPLDHCPKCSRKILDFDMSGCEDDDAQRWCVEHLPVGHPMAHLKDEAQKGYGACQI